MFRTCKAEEFFCNIGEAEKVQYRGKAMDDGKIVLTPSGKIKWREYIDSFRDSCDINIIMKRLKAGDFSALDAFSDTEPIYGDFTKFPTTYQEVLQLQIDAKDTFNKLPVEYKQKFDNDVNNFIATMNTPEWYEKLQKPEPPKVEVIADA